MVKLKVGGMSCQGCVTAVTRAVTTAAPGARVEVDLPGGTVVVEGGDAATAAEAIRRAGFTVEGAAG